MHSSSFSIANTPMSLEQRTYELTGSSAQAKEEREHLLRQLQQQNLAHTIHVPTDDLSVKRRLRQLGEPIHLFGESHVDRRDRLQKVSVELASRGALPPELPSVSEQQYAVPADNSSTLADATPQARRAFLTEGPPQLLQVRKLLTSFSIDRAKRRLHNERQQLIQQQQQQSEHSHVENGTNGHITQSPTAAKSATNWKKFTTLASQTGDVRPISSCDFAPNHSASAAATQSQQQLLTTSWSGRAHVWSVPNNELLYTIDAHTEMCTDGQWNPTYNASNTSTRTTAQFATCGYDATVKLWSLSGSTHDGNRDDTAMKQDEEQKASDQELSNTPNGMDTTHVNGRTPTQVISQPIATLTGHTARCCRLAWHPSGNYLASTSYDCTWNLYDVEKQQLVVQQMGTSRPTCGLDWHTDGALLCVTDLSSNGWLWDVRTGKTVMGLEGHAQPVLCCAFNHSDGYTLATGSADHTVKIWDLRKRITLFTIPAHTHLVSSVQFNPKDGSTLLTSSYDHSIKLWSMNDFTVIHQLSGGEEKVMRMCFSPDEQYIASASFDRSWRLYGSD